MRLFTGIALSPAATGALLALIAHLRPLANLKWTRPEKLHITTTFIGDWPGARLAELTTALATVRAPSPVEISIRGIGWLPNPRRPQALYAGVEPCEPLLALAAATAQAVISRGAQLESRIYRPHVTLARVHGKAALPLHADPIASFTAESFFLYLSKEGKYTKLEEFRFGQ